MALAGRIAPVICLSPMDRSVRPVGWCSGVGGTAPGRRRATEDVVVIVAIGLGALAMAMLQEAILARRNRGTRPRQSIDRNPR